MAEHRDEKGNRPLPHQVRRPRLTASEKNAQKNQATGMKALQTKGAKFRADTENCNNPSCSCWHPPVCLNYKSETGCKFGNKCDFRHVEADKKPSRKSKKGGAKGPVALLKESTQLCCVSQDSFRQNLFYVKKENWTKSHRQILQKHLAQNENSGRKGSIAYELFKRSLCKLFKSVNLMSVVLARQNSRTDHMRGPCNKKDAPAE